MRTPGVGLHPNGWRFTERLMRPYLTPLVLAWAALLLLAYCLERPALSAAAPMLGSWTPTAQLILDCLILAIVGWIARSAVWIFAATLLPWNLEAFVSMNVPWLVRLAGNAFAYPDIYASSLLATLAIHVILFASLFAGAKARRPTERPPSITSGTSNEA